MESGRGFTSYRAIAGQEPLHPDYNSRQNRVAASSSPEAQQAEDECGGDAQHQACDDGEDEGEVPAPQVEVSWQQSGLTS